MSAFLQGDVSRSPGSYGIDGFVGAQFVSHIAGGNIKAFFIGKWCGDANGRHALDCPKGLSHQIVRTGFVHSGGNDFSAHVVLPDKGSRKVGGLIPEDFPLFLSGFFVIGRYPGLFLIVVDNDHPLIMQDGRAGRAPSKAHGCGWPLMLPNNGSIPIQAIKSHVAKVDINMFPVGHRRLRSVGIFNMDGAAGCSLMQGAGPPNRAALSVYGFHHPGMDILGGFGTFSAKIETLDRCFNLAATLDRNHEDGLIPDNR